MDYFTFDFMLKDKSIYDEIQKQDIKKKLGRQMWCL